MKPLIAGLVGGLVLTGVGMSIPYRCCLNGDARGLPFAAYCPPCEATFPTITLGSADQATHVLDLGKLLGNLCLWGGVSVGVHHLLAGNKSSRNHWTRERPWTTS